MSLTSSARVRFDALRSATYLGIFGTYTGVGLPFAYPVRILKITNLTNATLIFSTNGVVDMDVVPADGFVLYDFCSNRTDQGGVLEEPAGDRIYVRAAGANPTTGTVYVTVIYASYN